MMMMMIMMMKMIDIDDDDDCYDYVVNVDYTVANYLLLQDVSIYHVYIS